MPSKIARIILAAVAIMLTPCHDAVVAQSTPDTSPSAVAATEQPALPPIVSFARSNSGWSANFPFADPVSEIQWSMEKDGPFESTGFAQVYEPRTRRPMANTSVEIESAAATIYVRYADIEGNWVGPFPVPFDPATEIRRWHRSLLEMTTQLWLSFRHDVPNILYYTHISGCRCAIREFRIGIDKPVPEQVVPLAPCDSKADVDTHIWIKPSVEFVSAQLVYHDGTVSKVKVFGRERSGN